MKPLYYICLLMSLLGLTACSQQEPADQQETAPPTETTQQADPVKTDQPVPGPSITVETVESDDPEPDKQEEETSPEEMRTRLTEILDQVETKSADELLVGANYATRLG